MTLIEITIDHQGQGYMRKEAYKNTVRRKLIACGVYTTNGNPNLMEIMVDKETRRAWWHFRANVSYIPRDSCTCREEGDPLVNMGLN